MKHPGYLIFELFSRFLAVLPPGLMYLFSDLLFFIGYYVVGYRKKVVFENLKKSFPEKDSRWRRSTALGFYRHLADVMIEDMAMLHMKPSRVNRMVTVKGLDILEDLYNKNKNITGLIGHYGNWELLTTLPQHTPYTILSVYKPLKNKFFNRKIYEMRKRFQGVPVPMKSVYQHIIQYENNDGPFITGFVSDQSPPRKSINYRTTFLNQETAFFTGGEKIARKFNHAVVFTAVKKIKRGSYQVVFRKLVEDAARAGDNEITERYVRALEDLIREEPRYWLWSHRRWKHQRGQ
jgi:KDO2-lipid IV(A) lauroyltransferase